MWATRRVSGFLAKQVVLGQGFDDRVLLAGHGLELGEVDAEVMLVAQLLELLLGHLAHLVLAHLDDASLLALALGGAGFLLVIRLAVDRPYLAQLRAALPVV